MPTNRLVEKEKVVTYASVLLDGVNAGYGQAGALEVRDQIEFVVRAMRENIDLAEALLNSGYTAEQKNGLVRSVFEGLNPMLIDCLAVMAEKGDMALLRRMWSSYEQQLQEKLNVTVVDVTTVVELDDHLREIITKKAADEFGTDVVLQEHIDPSILGGIVMSANGKHIDATISSQLDSARIALKQTTDGGEC